MRLTKSDLNKVNYDPWELCGMDSYCTKGCHEDGGCTKGCHILKMYKKLAKYEDLEEHGQLLRLPCKVGDTLHWYDFLGEYHKEFVSCIYVERGLNGIKIETACCQINAEEIGKTVFLTQAEAEEALKKMKMEE